ncbi:MAG: TVP38/TMEM64 family protein [Planctomycetes bacterium]|nr:TVP38/TMEM64 family protein [Planctomycetota bacterium]
MNLPPADSNATLPPATILSSPVVRLWRRLWPWLVLGLGIAAMTWSYASGGILHEMLRGDLGAAEKVELLQEFFRSAGVWAPLLYVGFVTIEVVVAPIPGLILYAPGGMIFGPLVGGALALVGNTLGAGLAATIARRLGAAKVEECFADDTRRRLHTVIAERGPRWIFWLRLNPLTSSDMVSYAAGLADIPARKVMAATACGMAPLCFAQAALSDGIFRTFPQLIYPLLGLCAVYVIAAIVLLFRQFRKSTSST